MSKIMFNWHDVMLIMTCGLSLFLAGPMLLRSQRSSASALLAFFILTQGLAAAYYLLLYARVFRPATLALVEPFQSIPLVTLYTLQGLLLLWYSRAMGGHRFRIRRIDLLLAIAMHVLALSTILVMMFLGYWDYRYDGTVLALPPLLMSVVYGFRAVGIVRRYDRRLRNHFSNIETHNLDWLTYAAFGFIGVWCIRLLAYGLSMTRQYEWMHLVGSGANLPAIAIISCMVILGLSQSQHALPRPQSGSDEKSSRKAPNQELIDKLENLMKNVKVYQDPLLDLDGLADSLGVSPRTLSSLINGHYQKNFYDFVNLYRVEEAKRWLQGTSAQSMTIQRVFETSGFNSKSTFNTFFKKVTGQTPSEFRNERHTHALPAPGNQ